MLGEEKIDLNDQYYKAFNPILKASNGESIKDKLMLLADDRHNLISSFSEPVLLHLCMDDIWQGMMKYLEMYFLTCSLDNVKQQPDRGKPLPALSSLRATQFSRCSAPAPVDMQTMGKNASGEVELQVMRRQN